MLSTNLK